jgi:chitodextrinase
MRGSGTSSTGRLRAATISVLTGALTVGLLATGAGPASAAPPVCGPTKTVDRYIGDQYVPYTIAVCIVTPGDDSQQPLQDPVGVSATATVTDPSGRAVVQRVTFRWKPDNGAEDTYLLSDNDPEQPGGTYRMSLLSNRLPDTPGNLVARAVVDNDNGDGIVGAAGESTADAEINIVKDPDTPPPTPAPFSPRTGAAPAPGARYTMAAVGDGADGSPESHRVVDVIKGWNPSSLGYLGDVYTNATDFEFDTWYGEAGGYGDLQGITNPVIGNHEYRQPGAGPYFRYWGGVPRWYSYDVGGWHVAVIDSNSVDDLRGYATPQTAVGTEQYQWLDADLRANAGRCTILMQHQPRYAEAPGSRAYLQDLWSLAYYRGVTLMLAGHVHRYERWTPMDAAGNPVNGGLTQIVAGGGGREPVNPIAALDSRVAARGGIGALRLDLGQDDVSFAYTQVSDSSPPSAVDQGSVTCRQRIAGAIPPPPDTTAPSTPTGLSARPVSPTAAQLSWQASSDDVGVTAYVVRRNGAVVATLAGGTTSWRDRGLAQGRTYRWTVEAVDAAGNRSALSAPVTATTPMPKRSTKRLLADLRTATEHRKGYTARRFAGWTDADGDRCATPREVFITEAVSGPSVRSGCTLTRGKWLSRYDGATRTSIKNLVADPLVGFREAWQSGAHRWSTLTRRQLRNDLGYPSTLIGVTKASATAKAGREPTDWLPRKAFRCSYLAQYVAVKWRWRLTVDGAERTVLKSRLAACGWPSVRLPSRPVIKR